MVCMGFLLTTVKADDNVNPQLQTGAVTFGARVESGEFIGAEQLRRLYISAGSNQIGFLVPSGMRVDLSRADRVTLTEPDLSYFLTLRINANVPAGSEADDMLRNRALRDYPGAMLTDEGNTEAAGRRGHLFTLRWRPAEGVDRAVTVAYIPNAAGLLEFSVVAEQRKSSEAQNALIGLLQRLQSSTGDRLRMMTFRQPDYN